MKPVMRRKSPSKPWAEMTTEELAKATAEFDREFIADTCTELSPAEGARFERARRKPARPRKDRGPG